MTPIIIAVIACCVIALPVILFRPKRVSVRVCAQDRTLSDDEVSLEDLSLIWTLPLREEIGSFSELAAHRKGRPFTNGLERPKHRPVFHHGEIEQFLKEKVYCKPFFLRDMRECVEEILLLLDREGDCPSVVNMNSREAEKGLEKDIYAALARVPLYRHSLNVAVKIVSLCNQEAIVPKAVISALGHDLGKIPSYHDRFYSTGDHSYISPTVLATMESFKRLIFADEIIDAIRCHHRPNPEHLLARRLKDADQACRMEEIAAVLDGQADSVPAVTEGAGPLDPEKKHDVKGQGNSAKQEETPVHPEEVEESGERPVENEVTEANKAVFGGGEVDTDIFGTRKGAGDIVNRRVKIDWFQPVEAIAYMKPFINRVKKGKITVLSMPDGYIYVEVGFLWRVAKKLSGDSPDLLAADADPQARRNFIFSMVEKLRKTGAIAGELLGEGYFMARFVIDPESDRPRELCFVPFLSHAFGEPVSVFESLKVGKLRDIGKVVPKHWIGADCDGAKGKGEKGRGER